VDSKKIIFRLIIIFLLHLTVRGHGAESSASFLPETDGPFTLRTNEPGNITKDEFFQTIALVETYYKPVVTKKLGLLLIQSWWDSNIINAYAQRVGPLYTITIHGGLARAKHMTKDGLALALCHELGHHLGGAPRSSKFLNGWASVEGQADYFASVRCLRTLFSKDDNVSIVRNSEIDQEAAHMCDATYVNEERAAVCKRIIMAGLSIANLMGELTKPIPELSTTTPDPEVVPKTLNDHPSIQCRLDTYFQGALCDKPLNSRISKHSPFSKAFCSNKVDSLGARPLCWFKP